MTTANYLSALCSFSPDERADAVRKITFSTVANAARGYATQYKIVRTVKPVRARGDGSATTVSVSRSDCIDLLLTTCTRTEFDMVHTVKRAAELLRGFDRAGSFSKAVVLRAYYLAHAGWSMSLNGDEREGCEYSAANNQSQEEALFGAQ